MTIPAILGASITMGAAATVLISLGKVMGHTKKFYETLDAFEALLKEARTADEITEILELLIQWAKTECWHRTLTAQANRVISFGLGKRSALPVYSDEPTRVDKA